MNKKGPGKKISLKNIVIGFLNDILEKETVKRFDVETRSANKKK
jgi:hypothetical protein